MSKFSSEIPKGDGWGVEDVVSDAVKRILAGEKSPVIPIVGMIDIKDIQIDPETHNWTAVVRVRRLESVTSAERIRAAQRMLMEQWAARKGANGEAILPFEEEELFRRAFSGIDEDSLEREVRDEKELARDQEMTEEERLRAHMIAAHSYDPSDSVVVDWPAQRVAQKHQAEHDAGAPGVTSAVPDHHEDDLRWRRIEMEELFADSEEPEPDPLAENDQKPLFSDGNDGPAED